MKLYIERIVKEVLQMFDERYPANFKNLRYNCVNYRSVPLFPKFLIPKIIPFIMKRESVSIGECVDIYRSTGGLEELENHKDSETLAILGSGSSINELSEGEFSFISSVDSMALNWWGVYHDFVPDFYKFELGGEMKEEWMAGVNEKSNKYEDTIFIYEPERMFGEGENATETLLELDQEIRNNIIDIRLLQYHRYKSKEFRDDIIPTLFPNSIQDRLLHYRGSLSHALAMAQVMGYENIILFGIDLNHSGYFFSEYEETHITTAQSGEDNERHATAKSTETKGIHEYIFYLNNNIFRTNGVSLYIGSEESLLYPEIPHYRTHPGVDEEMV